MKWCFLCPFGRVVSYVNGKVPLGKSNNEERGQSRKSRWSQSSGTGGFMRVTPPQSGPSCPAGGDVSWCSHYGDSVEVPKKLQTELSFPAVPLLSIYLDNHLYVPSSTVYSSYEMAVSYACITR